MANKRVLDPCCGSRMFWFDKNNPDVEFCDILEFEDTLCDGRHFSVAPDTIADFTDFALIQLPIIRGRLA